MVDPASWGRGNVHDVVGATLEQADLGPAGPAAYRQLGPAPPAVHWTCHLSERRLPARQLENAYELIIKEKLFIGGPD